MLLSRYMNKPSDNSAQNKPRFVLGCFSVLQSILVSGYGTALDTLIGLTTTDKPYRVKSIKYWVLGVCALLVLFNSVSGSNWSGESDVLSESSADTGYYEYDKHLEANGLSESSESSESSEYNASSEDSGDSGWYRFEDNALQIKSQVGPLEASDVIELLETLGFDFGKQRAIKISRYHFNQFNPTISNSNTNASLSIDSDNLPEYVIEDLGTQIGFSLPHYSTIEEAQDALNKLRKIAVIRTNTAYITCFASYEPRKSITMQILTRVVHVFDCVRLHPCFDAIQEQPWGSTEIDTEACWEEAMNTIGHAKYESEFQLEFVTSEKRFIQDWICSGIVILRPIFGVCLGEYEYYTTSLLSQLQFVNDYIISFERLPNEANMDLSFLATSTCRCSKIIIKNTKPMRISIIGLEDAILKHPMIILEISWSNLQYLGTYNKTPINVHTILGIETTSDSFNDMKDAREYMKCMTPLPPRVFATKIIATISTKTPCNVLDYYKQLYTVDAYAIYRIKVDKAEVIYENGRADLFETLDMLYRVNALPDIPKEVQRNHLIGGCEKLSTKWPLQDNVNIYLGHPDLDIYLDNYKKARLYFCQNIRYKTIKIDGTQAPQKDQTTLCLDLLALFQNMVADELIIKNVRTCIQITTSFDMKTLNLKKEAIKEPKHQISVKKLVLDTVDEEIVYWIVRHYEFISQIELHILNQRFTDMGIIQILADPQGQFITLLMINGFQGLNEVVYQNQRDIIEGFSVFRYIEEASQGNKSAETTGIHKLVLQLNTTEISLHSELLQEFRQYGIGYRKTLDQPKYISELSYFRQVIASDDQNIHIANLNFESIKTDFFSLQAQVPTLFPRSNLALNPNTNTQSLTIDFKPDLFLTEPIIATILRWVSCRFAGLHELIVRNNVIFENIRWRLRGRVHRFLGLDPELCIRFMGKPGQEVELLGWQSLRVKFSFYADVHDPTAELTAVSHTTISRLVAQASSLQDTIPAHMAPKATLKMLINSVEMRENDPSRIECSICFRQLYIPQDKEEGQLSIDLQDTFNPENHIDTFCYLRCGHSFCYMCIWEYTKKCNTPPEPTCPVCRARNVFQAGHHLISIPFHCFIFVNDCSNVLTGAYEWLKSITFGDNYVYMYFTYPTFTDLCSTLAFTLSNDADSMVYLV
ncbi:hypothetical protein NEHOM01_1247 [Nematocida homosporus]|uniref:uncharacterized protein n=1 Tax=Nematocida homosporus TaxID=1912981 RepID=UPI0022210A35|nr:uncharacterized protein NEHOM01_1247 [Nematocida homosporus]KAI5186044.1 hypothetical protein NEHOM01_1247 [Nematocida homosporus]